MRSTGFIVCAAFLLMLMPCAAFATSIGDLALVYRVSFESGTLTPSVDSLGSGDMKLGHSEVNGSMPTWVLEDGGLTLGITQPAGPLSLVGAGAFATPVDFGQGSIFGMRATFLAPAGPHQTGNIWAVGLGARTGDEDDLAGETRASATFQVRGNTARLNAVGASVPPVSQDLPQSAYDAIFDPLAPSAFTLELVVDRVAGAGYEALYVGQDNIFSRSFNYAAFTADGGPTITAIGPSLAISNAPGQSASVRVLNFEVFGQPPAVPEPSMWLLLASGLPLIGATKARVSKKPGRLP